MSGASPSAGETLPLAPAAWAARCRAPAARLARVLWMPMALAAVAVLVFAPALLNGFVDWDDSVNISQNIHFRGLGWAQIRWMLTTTLMGHYIPMTWLTLGLDYTIWGMNPLGYHLSNILLHAANAGLFYLIALRLLGKATRLTGAPLRLAGAIAALFFAVHPLRAESVAWVTERRDVLSGCLFLLSVLLYLASIDADGQRRRRFRLASLTCYALALLSKSIVMTLPLMLVVLDIYPLRRISTSGPWWRDASVRAVLKEKLPFLVLAIAAAMTSYAAVALNGFLVPLERYGYPARIGMVAHSLWFYLEKTLVPLALSPLYELPSVVNPLRARFLSSLLIVAAVTIVFIGLRRRWPAGLAIWACYALALLPVSGIVHAGHQLTHDRYSYLSCLGWALLVGGGVGLVVHSARSGVLHRSLAAAAVSVAVVWIAALATLTWFQVQVWRDTETLWRHAVDTDPQCSLCESNLGSALYGLRLLEPAREHFERALALRPNGPRPHGGVGLVLADMGDVERGVRHLTIAVAYAPSDPDLLANLGMVLANAQRHDQAIQYLDRALRLNPNHVPALVTLGSALTEMGRARLALDPLLRARGLRPDEPVLHFNLARAHAALGDRPAALAAYQVLVKSDPDRARSLEPGLFSVR
jgi:protein O-mannosyl-transferase